MDPKKRTRSRADIPLVERDGYRYRRYLADLAATSEPLASFDQSFGALRVFDDAVVQPGAIVPIQAHDGFEAVLYVLEGECLVEQGQGPAVKLSRNGAAYARLGRGVRHEIKNASSNAALRVLVAATVGPQASPAARLVVGSFARNAPDFVWIASDDPQDHSRGALLVGSPVRLGIATLDPGIEIRYSRAVNRGLYVNVLEGKIELDSAYVDEGADVRLHLESPVSLQGVTRACVVVADVAMGFDQQLE